MAKIRGPLMSLSASGTVGGALSFRQCGKNSIATSKAKGRSTNSQAQEANKQRMRDARTAFRTLIAADRAQWELLAVARSVSSWVAFFAEYQYQVITAPNKPLIPEATL